jgi:hypothetical protein
MLNKILAALLIVALAGIVGLGVMLRKADSRAVEATKRAEVYQRSFEAEKAAVGALEKSLAAQKKASAEYVKRAATDRAIAKQLKENLDEALKANRDWADQPVPDSVRDALTR